MNKILNEYRHFIAAPWNMRVLLVANFIYALVMPIIELFVGAYVLRNTHDVKMLIAYQLAMFTAIPFTFLVNGWLLRHISIKKLYGVGMMLSGCSMTWMMFLVELSLSGILQAGFIMGVAIGFYWANRDFLALSSTSDENRNYYYGIEGFFSMNAGILVPFLAGFAISGASAYGWFFGETRNAYYFLTFMVFVLSLLASGTILIGNFSNPPDRPYVYFRYHSLWRKVFFLAIFKGLVQGYMLTAPAMLIMHLVGGEMELGSYVTVSGIVSAVILYVLGRKTTKQHRVVILTVGLACFMVGALVNAILFNAIGALIFMIFFTISRPLQDMPIFSIMMHGIDIVSGIESRNAYSYILNNEFGLYIGRLIGLGVFLFLAFQMSNIFALRFSILIIGAVALFTITVARQAADGCLNYEMENPQVGDGG